MKRTWQCIRRMEVMYVVCLVDCLNVKSRRQSRVLEEKNPASSLSTALAVEERKKIGAYRAYGVCETSVEEGTAAGCGPDPVRPPFMREAAQREKGP